MRYASIVVGVLSFVLCCVTTVKLNALISQKIDAYVVGKIVGFPMGVALAGLGILIYSVLYGLPYETTPLCTEAIGVAVTGAGSLIGLLILLVYIAANSKKSKRHTLCGRAVALLYGSSAAIVAVVFCVDYFLV